MRILLDENLDWRLERFLPGHTVVSVQRNGWAGLKNGALLASAQEDFDVFITLDRGLRHQQHIPKFQLIVIGLRARSNRLQDTSPLKAEVIRLLPSLSAGTFTAIGHPESH